MDLQLRRPGPSLSPADFSSFEDRVGRSIPAEYRDFLLVHNGGRASGAWFPVGGDAEEVDIQAFFGIGMAERTYNIEDALTAFGTRLPQGFFPIAQDPGGNLIGVIDSGADTGTVMYWDLDLEGERDALSMIAPSFRCFVTTILKNRGDAV